MVPDNGYVVLDAEKYAALQELLEELGITLPFAFTEDTKNNVWYVADTDEVYEFFFESDYGEDLIKFYDSGWYLLSTKWVNNA